MKVLIYNGRPHYKDPLRRFVAKRGDLVEFIDTEADTLLATTEWDVPPPPEKKKSPKKQGG